MKLLLTYDFFVFILFYSGFHSFCLLVFFNSLIHVSFILMFVIANVILASPSLLAMLYVHSNTRLIL